MFQNNIFSEKKRLSYNNFQKYYWRRRFSFWKVSLGLICLHFILCDVLQFPAIFSVFCKSPWRLHFREKVVYFNSKYLTFDIINHLDLYLAKKLQKDFFKQHSVTVSEKVEIKSHFFIYFSFPLERKSWCRFIFFLFSLRLSTITFRTKIRLKWYCFKRQKPVWKLTWSHPFPCPATFVQPFSMNCWVQLKLISASQEPYQGEETIWRSSPYPGQSWGHPRPCLGQSTLSCWWSYRGWSENVEPRELRI